MQKFFGLFVVFCVLCASSSNAKLFEAKSFELDNGMRVLLIENHKAPVIKHMLWYKNGASDDAKGKGGTAHLLEHLMFRGTKRFVEGRLDALFEKHGAQSNAFTSYDYTSYHQFADISKLELLMLLEADRMHNLLIDDKNFAKEREIVYQERRQQIESNPVSAFMEKMREKLWAEHPYSRPVIGSADEIKSLTKQDVEEYYARFYTPENAILVLSGDLDLPTAKTLAEKYYGKLEKRSGFVPAPAYEFSAEQTKQSFVFYDKKVKTPRIVQMFVVPSYNQNPKEALALEILAEYLGADKLSPVYKDLVEKRKIMAGISVSNGFSARGYDQFYIAGYPQNNVDAQKAADELSASVKNAINLIDEKNIAAAKKRILANLAFVEDNPSDAAYAAGAMAAGGMSLEDINSYDENIDNVKLEDVKSTALKLIDFYPQIVGVIMPEKSDETLPDEAAAKEGEND